jgi:Xaa-Pro aminopeptidase
MFDQTVYRQRRAALAAQLESGLVLLIGHTASPINFAANPYPFRQDSSFLYYSGLNQTDCAILIDRDNGRETLYGREASLDDVIWTGPLPFLEELAAMAGIEYSDALQHLAATVQEAQAAGRPIHYLPAYRPDQLLMLGRLLAVSPERVNEGASQRLIQVVVRQRSVKTSDEIVEIESALGLCRKLFQALVKHRLQENNAVALAGILEGIAAVAGSRFAFSPIITSRGEILHNQPDNHPFKSSDLLLMDIGVESREHYASDITRTIPLSGRFSGRQKDIYEIVLAAQKAAIARAAAGVRFLDVHRLAATMICEGLCDLGLMKGAAADAVQEGAHALFFPHGLGHMLGLDVHDMEALGEDNVGYDAETTRSDQFGLAALRLGRRLEADFVVTVEPGIYFIPALMDQWRQEGRWSDFIAFDKLAAYRNFGGIRIEDVVQITPHGGHVLGPVIPKAVATLEAACEG